MGWYSKLVLSAIKIYKILPLCKLWQAVMVSWHLLASVYILFGFQFPLGLWSKTKNGIFDSFASSQRKNSPEVQDCSPNIVLTKESKFC